MNLYDVIINPLGSYYSNKQRPRESPVFVHIGHSVATNLPESSPYTQCNPQIMCKQPPSPAFPAAHNRSSKMQLSSVKLMGDLS